MVPDQFIDLDRRFSDLTESEDSEDLASRSYIAAMFGREIGVSWDELLASRLVVVLGEAGSGKTWELKRRVEVMRGLGLSAFYVPLDRLVTARLQAAMAPQDERAFASLKGHYDKCTFFLDSVDEAKIVKQQDFGHALDSFVRGIGTSGAREVRLVISSRVSEWRAHTDRHEVLRRFGEEDEPVQQAPEDDREEDWDTCEDRRKAPTLRVVQMVPLDRPRVRKFAEGRGLANPDAFVEAVDQHHAWDFVGRPIDAAALIHYWEANGALGTLTELIEFDLDNRLRENAKVGSDPLTREDAGIGAECLGAAVLFCKRFTFLVPDTVPPTDTTDALDASACLPPQWTQTQRKTMLARAVFDAATYGRIRFHHRRVAEYLAARWLEARMRDGCPYPEVESILFVHRGGRWAIRQSLRPVAAWLASGDHPWNRRIRNRILCCAPDLFLVHGDAESLPLEYKRSLLDELLARYSDRETVRVDSDRPAMARLADPGLAPDIASELLDRSTSMELRCLLVRLVRHGRLGECLPEALRIVASPDEHHYLKSLAVAAIRDLGDEGACAKLARIADTLDSISTDLCRALCEALYPRAIGPSGLATLLRKLAQGPHDEAGLPWVLRQHLDENLPQEHAHDLLAELLSLLQEPPLVEDRQHDTPVSARFGWLLKVIPVVLTALLRRSCLDGQGIALAAEALSRFDRRGSLSPSARDVREDLNDALDCHPMVRRAYVWSRFEQARSANPQVEPRLTAAFGSHSIAEQREADIDWLVQDIQEGASELVRLTALRLAIRLWYDFGRHRSVRGRIARAVRGDAMLSQTLADEAPAGVRGWAGGLYYRYRLYDWRDKMRAAWQWIEPWRPFLREQLWLLRNLQAIHRGEATRALSVFVDEASGEGRRRWGAPDWRPLLQKRWPWVARAARDGWKAAWRQFIPLLPHEKPVSHETDQRVAIGLSGINVGLLDGDLDFAAISAADARLACRYAVNELGGFPPWLPQLAQHHPESVREVLAKCIHGEYRIPADQPCVYDVLGSLRYHGGTLLPLVQGTILGELQDGDPPHYDILRDALTVIMAAPDPPRSPLARIAADRTGAYDTSARQFTLWLTVWLQVDAGPAVDCLRSTLSRSSRPDDVMARLADGFTGHHTEGHPALEEPDYLRPECLRDLVRLVYEQGPHGPTDNEDVQRFRSSLMQHLAQLPDPKVGDVLASFAEDSAFACDRDWILHLMDRHAEIAADAFTWSPADMPAFMQEHETTPRSDHDLFRIACKRFRAVKDEVETGELSSRHDLHHDDEEARLRNWLARQLRQRSRGRYTVPQEEEIDRGEKPDLRVEAPGMRAVSIEIKWADNWTLKELREGLVDQLVGQYLRAVDSNYGIYVLGYKGTKGFWETPQNRLRLSFEDLTARLVELAETEAERRDDIDGLRVFGIDFTEPSSPRDS